MKFCTPLLLLFFLQGFGHFAQAQIVVSGVILNAETKTPIPYAYVKKKKNNRGAITNEDGYFQLACSEGDSLVISFVSYDKLIVPYEYFLTNEVAYLTQSDNELATIQVLADFDFLYDLFDRARKNLQQVDDRFSKTYFSLESSTRNMPVELLECYYNAETGHNGLMSLDLKNGRVGMSLVDDTYYASLSSTQIMSNYDLYVENENDFPDNPLHYKRRKLRKFYDLKLVGFADNTYKIRFTPKSDKGQRFESYIWINKKTERIVKIKLYQKDLKRYPFVVIDDRHRLSDLNFELDYTFSNTDDQVLEKLEFNYDLLYDNRKKSRVMETRGVFLFYDPDSTFHLPHYSETDEILSDYDKVVAQPYNALFWENNEVLSPSKKVLDYRAFFEENGVLLNFKELEKRNESVFQNRIHPWSDERFFSDDINATRAYIPQATSMRDFMYTRAMPRIEQYNFVGHIYLDRNTFGDSTYYLSQTLIDRQKSYFYLKKSQYTVALINLYFDLIEIQRRDMMRVLESNYWTAEQSDSIYNVFHKALIDDQKSLLLKSDYGQDGEVIKVYNRYVKNELGIDNGLLTIQERFMEVNEYDQPLYDEAAQEVFSYASALFTVGRHEESINLLLKAHNNGATDPWLYYGLGVNFSALEMHEEACYYLVKSKELGMYVNPLMIQDCDE